MKSPLLMLAGASVLAAGSAAADVLTPVALSASETFSISDLAVIADGVIPPEETIYTSDLNYWWENVPGHWVQLDFGTTVTLTGVRASLDNNDTYAFSFSSDGVSFTDLFTFDASSGNVDPFNPGGMDTLSTLTGEVDFVTGTSFAATPLRYLRVTATGGDNLFAVGEVVAYGTAPVPEPATWASLAGLGVLGAALWRRRARGGR